MQNSSFNQIVKASGKTLYKVSKETGIPYTILSELSTGKKSINNVTSETVYKLSLYFSCSMQDILNPISIGNVEGIYNGFKYKWMVSENKTTVQITDKKNVALTKNYKHIYARQPFQIMALCAQTLIDELIMKKQVEEDYARIHFDA